MDTKTVHIPDGKGENDCRMLAKGGREEDSRRSVRSGEGWMQICGLKDDGRTGAILSEIIYYLGKAVRFTMRPRARLKFTMTNISLYGKPTGCDFCYQSEISSSSKDTQ